MTVKIRLKEIRKRRGLSQNKLAREMGMSLYGVQRYEYEKVHSIPLKTLNKFCIVLECSPGDILQFSPESENTKEMETV
jgi:putative transcriptional regulator